MLTSEEVITGSVHRLSVHHYPDGGDDAACLSLTGSVGVCVRSHVIVECDVTDDGLDTAQPIFADTTCDKTNITKHSNLRFILEGMKLHGVGQLIFILVIPQM